MLLRFIIWVAVVGVVVGVLVVVGEVVVVGVAVVVSVVVVLGVVVGEVLSLRRRVMCLVPLVPFVLFTT